MQRAVLLLPKTADDDHARGLALRIAKKYGEDDQTTALWSLSDTLPEWISVGMADQFAAHKRDAGHEAVYMVLFLCTTGEALDLCADGQWHSEQ